MAKHRASAALYNKLVDEAVKGRISKKRIEKVLRISPSSFKQYVKRISNGKHILYTVEPGYYEIPSTPLGREIVDERLTKGAKGFFIARENNNNELFAMLGLTNEARIKRVLSDPLYKMAVNKLGSIKKFTLVGPSTQPQESTEAM